MIIENSKIPKILSRVAPINILAITLWPFVFCKGTVSETTKRHETIHLHQQRELLVLPFFLLYVAMWIIALVKYRDGAVAYRKIPFEQEAYSNEEDEEYLSNRRRFAWREYKI